MPENKQAAEVYMMCRNQFITTGMGNIIDINIQSVIETMKLHPDPIVDPWICLSKIRSAFHELVIKKQEESNNKGCINV